MVKVISAYNFQQQNTYPASGDIAASCLIGPNRLAIAHRNHLIEILTLSSSRGRVCKDPANSSSDSRFAAGNGDGCDRVEDRRCYIDQNDNCQPTKIAFPTIDLVEQLYFCAAGNYLLTLEHKADAKLDRIKQRTFVRAYTNFDIASSVDDCFSVPIRARIASKTTPNVTCGDHIEVIEIPISNEIPAPPHLVTCCQTSGTIAVCCEQQIHFYECRRRTNDANKFQFIDFFEAPFYIQLDFKPFKISLSEHVISCMDASTVAAFKIVDLGDIGTEDGTTTNSIETDSSTNPTGQHNPSHQYSYGNYFSSSNQRRNKTIDFEVAKQYNQANGVKFQTDIRSNWDHDSHRQSSFSEDRPYLVNDVKIMLKSTNENISSNDRIFYSVRSLVQLRLHQQNELSNYRNTSDGGVGCGVATIHDEFRCMALKPIYFKLNQSQSPSDHQHQNNITHHSYDFVEKGLIGGEGVADSNGGHFMKSSYHGNCIGFTLFISTVSDGYVYQFTNQGKWYTENTKCLAVYPFTSPVVDVIIDNFVVHAITENGIETFSSRIGHKLFSSYFEYPMITDPYPNETSPLVDVPICVMGICGFFGIRHVASTSKNLVLLTTDNEPARSLSAPTSKRSTASSGTPGAVSTGRSSNLVSSFAGHGNNNIISSSNEILDWTIYDLELPKPEVLVDDIVNLARIYRQNSPEIYYELIEEAHVIIRLAREFLSIPTSYDYCDDANGSSATSPIESQDEYTKILNASYLKTCKMLADFTIQSNRKETYSQAVAYYSMCKHSIIDIYTSYRESNSLDSTNSNSTHDGLIYTLTLMLSRVGSNKSGTEYLTQILPSLGLTNSPNDRTCAEELFELFLKYSPDNLTHIALSSSVFREILNDRFYQLYTSCNLEQLSPEKKVCLVLCLCYQNKRQEALKVMETLRRSQVYTVLRDNWSQLLFDNFQSENYRKCSFSDLTEAILFVTECTEIIEAVADVIIRILIVTHSIDLNLIIKLFMNYFAMNVGCPGYRTSQKILEIVLQAYFYDYYKYNSRIMLVSGAGQGGSATDVMQTDLQSQLNLFSTDRGQYRPNTIVYSSRQRRQSLQLSDNSSASTVVDSNYEDPEFEAMKILFRMYLGLLKQSTTERSGVVKKPPHCRWNGLDVSTILPDVNGFRLAFIDYLYHNTALIKTTHAKFDTHTLTNQQLQMQLAPILPDYDAIGSGGVDCRSGGSGGNHEEEDANEYWQLQTDSSNSFHRPIVFFERRENYLNKMPPLCLKTDVNGVPFSNDWDETSSIVIKIQSLLNSGKLDSSLIDDIIAFINSNPNVIGVDSLLTILLPKSEGIELLIHTNPQYLLDYAKVRLVSPNQWQILFKKILRRKRELNAETHQAAIELYDRVMEDILRHLVATKPLDEFLECIPENEINRNEYKINTSTNSNSNNSLSFNDENNDEANTKDNSFWKLGKYRAQTQDGVDEMNPFELIMREAVVKQRSDALDAMIQSSGRQLNDAVNNFQLNFN